MPARQELRFCLAQSNGEWRVFDAKHAPHASQAINPRREVDQSQIDRDKCEATCWVCREDKRTSGKMVVKTWSRHRVSSGHISRFATASRISQAQFLCKQCPSCKGAAALHFDEWHEKELRELRHQEAKVPAERTSRPPPARPSLPITANASQNKAGSSSNSTADPNEQSGTPTPPRVPAPPRPARLSSRRSLLFSPLQPSSCPSPS